MCCALLFFKKLERKGKSDFLLHYTREAFSTNILEMSDFSHPATRLLNKIKQKGNLEENLVAICFDKFVVQIYFCS